MAGSSFSSRGSDPQVQLRPDAPFGQSGLAPCNPALQIIQRFFLQAILRAGDGQFAQFY